jgi:phenylalanine-4-hydroxylase
LVIINRNYGTIEDRNEPQLLEEVMVYLESLKQRRPEVAHLITGGLDLIF